MNITVINASTISKNWFLIPLKKFSVLNVRVKKSNVGCLPLPFRAEANSRAQPVPHAGLAQPPVALPVAPNNRTME
jgi:hypothetical protein